MVRIETEKQFNDRRDPGFCYLCGRPFEGSEAAVNREDVVPQHIFLPGDKTQVFKLLAHETCNTTKSKSDVKIGQVLKILQQRAPPRLADYAIELTRWTDTESGEQVGGISDFEIEDVIFEWIQGFHALLYKEFLPKRRFATAGNVMTLPWPTFRTDPNNVEPLHPHHQIWVLLLKKNRFADNIDAVTAWNGRLQYQCVWDCHPEVGDVCIFAIQVYNWSDLGMVANRSRQSCTGIYTHPRPADATYRSELLVRPTGANPNDAFASL